MNKVQGTIRQKLAAKILVENKGRSVSDAMRKAGYSPKSAKNPKQLTETKAWPMLMKQLLPDSLVMKVHKQLLKKKEVFVIGKELVYTEQPHSDAKAGIDMAYKLKGRYAPVKVKSKVSGLEGFLLHGRGDNSPTKPESESETPTAD
jgi:hypothetical protein